MHRLRLRRPGRRPSRGQSLVEFGLLLPLLLVLTLIAIDFGRVYLGWVNLQNMARIAANYAANNPTAWATNDTSAKTIYQNQILADAKQNNCGLPIVSGVQTAPDPVFSPDTNIGSTAQVGLSCTFKILTPIISSVVGTGGNLTVSASSTFPIKTGLFASGGGGPVAPIASFTGSPTQIVTGESVQFTDSSTGTPTTWAWTFGDSGPGSTAQNPIHPYLAAGTYTVSLTVSNSNGSDTSTRTGYITVTDTPPPPDPCTVPNFVSPPVKSNAAPGVWAGAGFTSAITFAGPNGNKDIVDQSLTADGTYACDTSITLTKGK